jgi:hypothetical protein
MMILSFFIFSLHLKAENLDPNILKLKEQVDTEVKTQGQVLQCATTKEDTPFTCTDFKTPNQCLMKKCVGKISKMVNESGVLKEVSLDVDVFLPQKINRLSVYFHGHVLNDYQNYSNSISNSNDPSQLREKICSSSSATFMPKSLGNCTTYDRYFKSSLDFNEFVDKVSTATSIPDFNSFPISISAHSGGGRALARILLATKHRTDGNANERIDQAVFYDGIYNSWQPDIIANWVKSNTNVKLTMVALSPEGAIKQLSPYTYSKLVLQKISGVENLPQSNVMIQSRNYSKTTFNQNSNQVYVLTRPTDANHTQSHFDVIKETWAEVNQK